MLNYVRDMEDMLFLTVYFVFIVIIHLKSKMQPWCNSYSDWKNFVGVDKLLKKNYTVERIQKNRE